jgi:hypothetical protein
VPACSFLYGHGIGEKELLGVAPATSCDGETTKRRRVASRTHFVSRRLAAHEAWAIRWARGDMTTDQRRAAHGQGKRATQRGSHGWGHGTVSGDGLKNDLNPFNGF